MATGILRDLADGAKRLGEIKKEFSDLEFNERILELRQLLMSAQAEILSLRGTVVDLDSALVEAQKSADFSNNLIEVAGFKYDLVNDKPSGFPYCPTCEIKESKFYRLVKRTNPRYSKCANCETVYNVGQDGLVNQDTPHVNAPRLKPSYF